MNYRQIVGILLIASFLQSCGDHPQVNTSINVDTSINLFPISVNGQWGYINKRGEIIIKPQFNSAGEFSEGLAWVSLGFSQDGAFINEKGEVVFKTAIFF